MSSLSSAIDRAGFYLFTLCVSLAPLPFGASEPASAAVIGVVLALCLMASGLLPRPQPPAARLAGATLVLAGIVLGWSTIQASGPLASAMHPAWHMAQELVEAAGYQTATIRYALLSSTGYVLIPLAGFACALIYVRDDARYLKFAHVLLAVNFVLALLCIGQYAAAPNAHLWADKPHYRGSFTGTFINPNTAATHFGFLFVLSLAHSLRQLQTVNLRGYLAQFSPPSRTESGKRQMLAAYASATFLFLIALLSTKSRAGILAALAGSIVLAGGFAFFTLRKRTSRARVTGITVIGMIAVLLPFFVFGERFLLRLEHQGLLEPGRLCSYMSTWSAIRDGGWAGTGIGTFADIFPAYRQAWCSFHGHWEMAHSFILEGWLVLGVVFLACMGLTLYQLIITYRRGLRERRRYRFVPLACLGLLVTLTVHSLVDFSLQVPGFAIAAAAILGAGAAVSLQPRRPRPITSAP